MVLFAAAVVFVLVMSALCSLFEAALYAVRMAFIETLPEKNRKAARLLTEFKQNMDRPISAILIVNTTANTAGAAIAGAQAATLFGETAMVWFTGAFTIAVLVLAEIVPKVVGVTYNRLVAPVAARPVAVMIAVLHPAIWMLERLTHRLRPDEPIPSASEAELVQFAHLSAAEGSILAVEANLIRNSLRLNDLKATDLMTRRDAVIAVPGEWTVRQAVATVDQWGHSRIPLVDTADVKRWRQMVHARDLLRSVAGGQLDVPLAQLGRPLDAVSHHAAGHELLARFLSLGSELCQVVDEHGLSLGLVGLQDVLGVISGAKPAASPPP